VKCANTSLLLLKFDKYSADTTASWRVSGVCLMYVDVQPYGCSHNPRLVITHPADTNYADTLVGTAQRSECSCVATSPKRQSGVSGQSHTLVPHRGLPPATPRTDTAEKCADISAGPPGPWPMAHGTCVHGMSRSCQLPTARPCRDTRVRMWMQHRLLTCTL
jgi:hypothetical protein